MNYPDGFVEYCEARIAETGRQFQSELLVMDPEMDYLMAALIHAMKGGDHYRAVLCGLALYVAGVTGANLYQRGGILPKSFKSFGELYLKGDRDAKG